MSNSNKAAQVLVAKLELGADGTMPVVDAKRGNHRGRGNGYRGDRTQGHRDRTRGAFHNNNNRGNGRGSYKGRGAKHVSFANRGALVNTIPLGPPGTPSGPKPARADIECYNCKGKGHFARDCTANGRAPRARRLWTNEQLYRSIFELVALSEPSCDTEDIARVMSARCVGDASYNSIVVTNDENGRLVFVDVLLDSGADLSGVALRRVKEMGVPIIAPLPHEQQWIDGAVNGMRTRRLGHVVLRCTFHFPIPNGSTAVTFTKKYEVMDMELDFILGREVNRVLFPNDQINQFGGPHSTLTDAPHDIDRQDQASVRMATTSSDEVGIGETFSVDGMALDAAHVRRTSAAAPAPAASADRE